MITIDVRRGICVIGNRVYDCLVKNEKKHCKGDNVEDRSVNNMTVGGIGGSKTITKEAAVPIAVDDSSRHTCSRIQIVSQSRAQPVCQRKTQFR